MTNMEYEALKVGALLHDIGKFTKEFLEAGLGCLQDEKGTKIKH